MINKKRELSNPARFWVGAVMGLFELVGLGLFVLNSLDWSWITERLLLTGFCITAVLLYNFLAGMLILNGSKKK
jgi:hypothetical protein